MTELIRTSKTERGRPSIIDVNNFSYIQNGQGGAYTQPWRCSTRTCNATLRTRKSTGQLMGDALPEHSHNNQLLKKTAKETEKNVLEKYAAVPCATASTVLQDISSTMLSSSFPGQLSSASTAGAIRMKVWRQRQAINPRPKLPTNFEQYMNTDIPEKYSRTADGGDFMICKEWIDSERKLPLVLFISQWGADVLKRHPVWMFDGTFESSPPPFTQVIKFIN